MGNVEITYTVGDLYAAYLRSWRSYVPRIFILFGLLIVTFITVPIVLYDVSLGESMDHFPFEIYIGFMAGVPLFIVSVSPLIAHFRLRRQGALGPKRLAFLDEGVRFEGANGQSLVYWSAVKRVTVTRNRLILFIGAAPVFMLPARAFSDRASFEAAIDEARARRTAAKK